MKSIGLNLIWLATGNTSVSRDRGRAFCWLQRKSQLDREHNSHNTLRFRANRLKIQIGRH